MAKISKENRELAEKITNRLGTIRKSGSGEGFYVDFNDANLPYQAMQWGETEDEATDNAIETIANDLQNGDLVLSDTWEADNL